MEREPISLAASAQIDAYGDNETLTNQSKAGNVTPNVRKASKRRKRVYGNGDRRVTRWFWSLGENWILTARNRPARRDSKDAEVVRTRYRRCSGNMRINVECTM